jgi:hypothetical protein
LNVHGLGAASDLSRDGATISFIVLAALITKARDIVRALVNRRRIGCAAIAGPQPSHPHRKAPLPTQPSHALFSILKTLLKFGRKMRPAFRLSEGYVYSDWQPCLPRDWATLPDISIPDFLMRRITRAEVGEPPMRYFREAAE